MIRYTTRNSVYLVDVEGERFMRESGANPVTSNFVEDGLWHAGKTREWGDILVFTFADGVDKFTTSSRILSAEETA